MYQLACYEGGRDYVLFLVGGSPLIEPSLAQKTINDSQEPTGGGYSDHAQSSALTSTSVLVTLLPTVENYHLGGMEKTWQSGPVHRMGGLAEY